MAGDTYASVRSLYDAAYRRLVGVVALAAESQQDAEECVQEAFMRLLPRWQTVSRYDDPEAWVRGLAVRTMITRLRRRQVVAQALVRLVGREDPARGPA
ncbi:MAG: hypothetical protein QOI42_1589, partial [Frankiaceae bacterium]|nr:hypothetical protein [Frankiaceae bacterium]